jgi:hypothetical protein
MKYLVLSYPYHKNNPKWLRDKQNKTFPQWLNKRVSNLMLIRVICFTTSCVLCSNLACTNLNSG